MRKALIGCAAGALVAISVAAFLLYWFVIRESPTLTASLNVPAEVQQGGELNMVLTLSNLHARSVTLDSIDIDDEFLEGFQVLKVEPEPRDTTHIFGQRSWEFDRRVDAGGSLTVTFTLRAAETGRFVGDIDVCNPGQDFRTVIADVIVRDREGEKR